MIREFCWRSGCTRDYKRTCARNLDVFMSQVNFTFDRLVKFPIETRKTR